MPQVVVAEVTEVDPLDRSRLLDEQRRAEVGRLLGRPCTVVCASYSLEAHSARNRPLPLSEVRAALEARGIRLGAPLERKAEGRRPPVSSGAGVEVTVRESGERRVFPVCDTWVLSVPMGILFLYARLHEEVLADLLGQWVEVRQVVEEDSRAGPGAPPTAPPD